MNASIYESKKGDQLASFLLFSTNAHEPFLTRGD